MKKNLLALSLALALTGGAPILHAEESASASTEGNSDAGREKSGSCASCHGQDGNSMMPAFPKLAQQHASYLSKQLYAFKDGSRKDQVMGSMAQSLTDTDIADVSAYYAEQKISENPEPTLPPADDDEAGDEAAKATMPELLNKGSNLYRNGDLSRAVSACIACHGPSGEGNKPASFPAVRSQHADYLIKTLNDFKAGVRSKNSDNMMNMVAKKMTEDEIKAVSYYISTMK